MVNFFAKFLEHKYYHRICGRSLEHWAEQGDVNTFRKAIWRYVCFDEKGNQDILINHEHFRPWGWIDCMKQISCQPGSGPVGEDDARRDDRFEIQRAFYTHYGHVWGMKTQAVHLPNGIVGSCYFTSIAQNDKGVVNISGIEEELARVLQNHKLVGECT